MPLRTLEQAEELAEVITRECHTVLVTGYRHYQDGAYAIECVDLITGYPFEVLPAEDRHARHDEEPS